MNGNDPGLLFSDLITGLLEFLPRLVLGVAILVVGWVAVRVVAAVVRRILVRVGLDRIARRAGLQATLEQAQIRREPSDLIALLVFWIGLLSILLLALETLGLGLALAPLRDLLAFLPRVFAGVLVLLAGVALAQVLERAVEAGSAGLGIEYSRQLGRVVRWLILVVTVIVAVQQLGIDLSVLTQTIVNLMTILIAGLALTFALGGREVARNALAGYYARELFSPGDQLLLDGQEGTLEAIGPLNAEVSLGEDLLMIPNRELIESRVVLRKAAGE